MTQQNQKTSQTQEGIRQLSISRGRMLNLDRILVPLNGYRRSEQILPYASMLADWFNGEITLFHSLPNTHPARGARPGQVQYPDAPHDRGTSLATAYLEEVVSRLGPHGIKSRWGIATGDAAQMITSRSSTSAFGLIATAITVRSRTHRFFSHGLLENLWRKTSAPLLIVNPNNTIPNNEPPNAPKSIIVPWRKDSDDFAMPIAIALAGASRSNIKIVIRKSTPPEQVKAKFVDAVVSDQMDIEIIEPEKNFTKSIASLQNSDPGAWIVTRSRMRSGIGRSVFGSMTDTLAREASGPIVVIPDPDVINKRKRQIRTTMRDIATSR
tara:strand:- start:4280 stop:5254 length:975 start_codon:yes stop_codon:yes gene_type:complete